MLVIPSGYLLPSFPLLPNDSSLSMSVWLGLKFGRSRFVHPDGLRSVLPPTPACLTTKDVRLSMRLIRRGLLTLPQGDGFLSILMVERRRIAKQAPAKKTDDLSDGERLK